MRTGNIDRKTNETDIKLNVNLDGSGAQCCFDKTHKSNLLFAPASDFCRRFVQYSIPDGNCIANRLLQFGADGCRIWASTQIQGSL